MRNTVEVLYAEDGLGVARFDRVVITLVRSAITSEFLEESFQVGKRAGRRHAGGIASLTLTRFDTPIPEGRLREEASRLARESGAWLRAGATVVAGQGFAASAIRSVIMAMTLLTTKPPRRAFATARDASDWLAGCLDLTAEKLSPVVAWSELALGDDYRSLLLG